MSSLIDIVFLLLVFFVMTFKIVATEGDLGVQAPLTASPPGPTSDLPIRVCLTATPDGQLSSVRLNDRRLDSVDDLTAELLAVVEPARALSTTSPTVVLQCDYHLNYQAAIDAISAIRGYVDNDKQVVPLIETIRFAPPRRSGSGLDL